MIFHMLTLGNSDFMATFFPLYSTNYAVVQFYIKTSAIPIENSMESLICYVNYMLLLYRDSLKFKYNIYP
jgi:hypothetical protein